MNLARIMLRTPDLERSLTFWVDQVGLSLTSRGGPFAFLESGAAELVLHEVQGTSKDTTLTELVFEVDDIDAEFAELTVRGVPFEVEPRVVTVDGLRSLKAAHFRDPDGHLASITGWVEPEG